MIWMAKVLLLLQPGTAAFPEPERTSGLQILPLSSLERRKTVSRRWK